MTTLEFNHRIIKLQKPLEMYALGLTTNSDDAKDLLQETMLKAFSNRDKFIDKTNLKAWLYTIMKNTFINEYRRNKRANTFIDKTDNQYFLNNDSSSEMQSADSRIAEKDIRKALSELTNDFRVPFEMYYNGYKYKEIAEELSLSIGTVKSRIFFTRKKLMKKLQDYQ
jgi:RNA polymerase sigma-70 factor, ECF subfamily